MRIHPTTSISLSDVADYSGDIILNQWTPTAAQEECPGVGPASEENPAIMIKVVFEDSNELLWEKRTHSAACLSLTWTKVNLPEGLARIHFQDLIHLCRLR